eukprot:6173141-Alexandrium_andersonii.AAC.1
MRADGESAQHGFMEQAAHEQHMCWLNKLVKESLLEDKRQHVEFVAMEAASAFAAHSIRDAMTSLR